MRSLTAVLVALWFSCVAGGVDAGGFTFDPNRCPTGNWLPSPSIPQIATDTLCKFLVALDRGDVPAAFALFSTDFASEQSPHDFSLQLEQLQGRGEYTSPDPPERSIVNVRSLAERPQGGVYVFSIQVFGGSRGYQEDVYIRVDQGQAKVVGLRIGPG
jgi:hypothetical protein